jgi:Mrp family chromosome partitioning ATPase
VRAGDAFAARAAATLAAVSSSSFDDRPDRPRRGVLGALTGVPLEECVLDTEVPNLAVLPVGDAGEQDAKCLSREAVDRLLAACRQQYDTIVIDTGPVLGSMEAAFVCAAADDVVVVVARGERRPVVDDALARVSRIGAEVAGVVFNRASTADVSRTSYASRSASVAAEVA